MKYEAEYTEIYKLMEAGDFRHAVEKLTRLTEKGEAQAGYILGYMFYGGKGVERSTDIALGYLHRSAELGFEPAKKLLTQIVKKSNVTREEAEEIKKNADGGDVKSSYNFAMLCMRGDGIDRSKDVAIRYFTYAAEHGHMLSMIALFDRYAIDADIEKQWSRAYYWFKQAWVADKDRLNIVHPNIIRAEKRFIDAQDKSIPKEERKALLEEAAKEGFHGAYTAYGDLLDPADAIYFYEKGAEFGDCDALKRLALAYKNGVGVEKDQNNADFYNNEYERLSVFIGK